MLGSLCKTFKAQVKNLPSQSQKYKAKIKTYSQPQHFKAKAREATLLVATAYLVILKAAMSVLASAAATTASAAPAAPSRPPTPTPCWLMSDRI